MKKTILVVPILVLVWGTTAFASMEQIKIYKEAFPDAKPKCITCHTDALPKKDDGKHELNAYGKEVLKQVKEGEKATAESYKAVGPVENFKAPEEGK